MNNSKFFSWNLDKTNYYFGKFKNISKRFKIHLKHMYSCISQNLVNLVLLNYRSLTYKMRTPLRYRYN